MNTLTLTRTFASVTLDGRVQRTGLHFRRSARRVRPQVHESPPGRSLDATEAPR